MPLYEYACGECEHRFDIRQNFGDDPLTVCPNCGGPIRRVVQPVGIVFKGSGFYKTDSRSASEAGVPAAERKAEGGESNAAPTGATSESTSTSSSDGATAAAPAKTTDSPAPAKPAKSESAPAPASS